MRCLGILSHMQTTDAGTRTPAPSLLPWRALALVYDFFPALALWFVVAVVFTALHGDSVRGGVLGLAEFVILYGLTGLYATASWRRGGQTIGMKPWHLYVDAASGGRATLKQLWLRYTVGSLSLLCAGAGFWWAFFDRDKLTWHDRLSHTRLVRDKTRDGALA